MSGRRIKEDEQNHISNKNKARLIVMFISIFLMIFCIFQVYYLARYTFGKSVPEGKLKVYKWVRLLVDGNKEEGTTDTDYTKKE